MKNTPVIITVQFPDGREGRIWTEFNEESVLFVPNLPDECDCRRKPKCKISYEIDMERLAELQEIEEAKAAEQKERVSGGERHPEIIAPRPARWTFSDGQAKVSVHFGFPDEDEAEIRLDFKNDKSAVYWWCGKYSVGEKQIELFVTDFSETYEDGVMGYGTARHLELPYSADGGTLRIDFPLSDNLPFADTLAHGYKFPSPLILTKEMPANQVNF